LAAGKRGIEERDLELAARRADLERSARRIDELEQVAARLAERVVDRERELRELRADLERVRERGDAGLRALAGLAEDLEGVRRQARGQATRMRLRALRQAAELTRSSAELARRPGETTERLLASIEGAIERIGVEDEEEDLADAAESNGHVRRTPGEVFEGLVEVEVGPLSDFSQLVGFEDAACGIGATSEVSVKRFSQGRATLSMRFKHPVELLRELEERAPFDFVVRDTRSDRIVLDVDE
jgi:ABC-type transporter Mla subunit MlaD